jgi:2-phospho-L-lactate transferase/gluconeogenesis factor (CofD/UPF0052 family)
MSQSTELTIKTPLESYEFHFGNREVANLFGMYTANTETTISDASEAVTKLRAVFQKYYPTSTRSAFILAIVEEQNAMINHLMENIADLVASEFSERRIELERLEANRQLSVLIRLCE